MLPRVLLIILILMVILISGCVSVEITREPPPMFKLPEPEPPPPEVVEEPPVEEPPVIVVTKEDKIEECLSKAIPEKNTCLNALALAEDDKEICRKMDIQADVCLKEIAVARDDSTLCKEIDSNVVRNNCFYLFAQKLEENALCYQITTNPELRDNCYTELAVSKDNYLICKNVSLAQRSGSYARDACYSKFLPANKYVELCLDMADANVQRDCYLDVGKSNLDVNTCAFLSLTADKDECIKYVAEQSKNSEVCELLSTMTLRQDCTVAVSEIVLETDACSGIINADERNSCYRSVADTNLDAAICNNISNLSVKEDCYLSVALKTDDAVPCASIRKTTTEWDTCYSTIGKALNDYTLCENLHDQEKYMSCFVDVAVDLDLPEVCTSMQRSLLHLYTKYPPIDMCYKEVSIELGKESLCELIASQTLRDACTDANTAFR